MVVTQNPVHILLTSHSSGSDTAVGRYGSFGRDKETTPDIALQFSLHAVVNGTCLVVRLKAAG